MIGACRVLTCEPRCSHNAQAVQLQSLWLRRKEAVGVQDIEGLNLSVEHLVLAALVAVVLISQGDLRVKTAAENEFEHTQVLVRNCRAAV